LDQVRDAIRRKHYAYRTKDAYVSRIRHYILFHDKRHPKEIGAAEIEAFLTYLAQERHDSASTQNQALSAILFLYREVLHMPVSGVEVTWANKPKRLPTVLTQQETTRVLAYLTGTNLLMGQLLYGAGPVPSAPTRRETNLQEPAGRVRLQGYGGDRPATLTPDHADAFN
jgi:site-specific recombinase XerD